MVIKQGYVQQTRIPTLLVVWLDRSNAECLLPFHGKNIQKQKNDNCPKVDNQANRKADRQTDEHCQFAFVIWQTTQFFLHVLQTMIHKVYNGRAFGRSMLIVQSTATISTNYKLQSRLKPILLI